MSRTTGRNGGAATKISVPPAALAACLCLFSCAAPADTALLSPSGALSVSYSAGTMETDTAHDFTDTRTHEVQSVSGGYDTPLDHSRFIWSDDESVVAVQQSDRAEGYDRVLVVMLRGRGRAEEPSSGPVHWLLRREPFEARYFGGRPVGVRSVSRDGVTFARMDGGGARHISLGELRMESARQEALRE